MEALPSSVIPLSRRKRTVPESLAGEWKSFDRIAAVVPLRSDGADRSGTDGEVAGTTRGTGATSSSATSTSASTSAAFTTVLSAREVRRTRTLLRPDGRGVRGAGSSRPGRGGGRGRGGVQGEPSSSNGRVPVASKDDDISTLWLPGGITAEVEVDGRGNMAFRVGWIVEGVRLVMERRYNGAGVLTLVQMKSEVKGGWVGRSM